MHQSILDLKKKEHGAHLDSADVLVWLLEQTCIANKESQQLYLMQGSDFCRRTNAAWAYPEFLVNSSHRGQ